MRWRSSAGIAGVSAVVAALFSALITLIVVRVVGMDDDAAATGPVPGRVTAVATTGTGLTALFAGLASGIVRIETTACTEGSVGSGFLIAPDLVATVAHVVSGAHKIVLTVDGKATPGTVVGLDAVGDLALVRADRAFSGHVFALADHPPAVGSEVLGFGYPSGGGLSLVHGTIAALDRSVTVTPATGPASGDAAPSPSPSTIAHVLQIEGLFTGGDSGGPLVAADGSVVGLVEARATQEQGVGFALGAVRSRAAFARWRAHPQPVQVSGDCAAPVGPPDAVAQVSDVSGSPDGPAVQSLLGRFATALNAGRYAEAFALFSPAARHQTTLQEWTARERSSRLFDIVVHQVQSLPAGTGTAAAVAGASGAPAPTDTGSPAASGSADPGASSTPATTTGRGTPSRPTTRPAAGRSLRAEITFTSVQDAALGTDGQVCSLWHLYYQLTWSGGGWRIERAVPEPGSPQAC